MEPNLLDRLLSAYLEKRQPVVITLQNKVRITGTLRAFDSYVLVVEGRSREIVYRHAVASVAPSSPAEPVAIPKEAAAPQQTRAPRPAASKPRPAPRAKEPAASHHADSDPINSGMKEGLLRWMQDKKASGT